MPCSTAARLDLSDLHQSGSTQSCDVALLNARMRMNIVRIDPAHQARLEHALYVRAFCEWISRRRQNSKFSAPKSACISTGTQQRLLIFSLGQLAVDWNSEPLNCLLVCYGIANSSSCSCSTHILKSCRTPLERRRGIFFSC